MKVPLFQSQMRFRVILDRHTQRDRDLGRQEEVPPTSFDAPFLISAKDDTLGASSLSCYMHGWRGRRRIDPGGKEGGGVVPLTKTIITGRSPWQRMACNEENIPYM